MTTRPYPTPTSASTDQRRLDIERERATWGRLTELARRIAEVVEDNAPFCWQHGDGHGGSIYQLIGDELRQRGYDWDTK